MVLSSETVLMNLFLFFFLFSFFSGAENNCVSQITLLKVQAESDEVNCQARRHNFYCH